MMSTRRRFAWGLFCAAVLVLTMNRPVWADPVVTFTVKREDSGGFLYNLILDNSGGGFTVSGLIVVNGFSVFGLKGGSTIGAPQDVNPPPGTNWGVIPPLPPFADNLAYFSPGVAGDIPPDEVLSGFSFRSTKDPKTLVKGNFSIVVIDALTGGLTDIGDARPGPGGRGALTGWPRSLP